MSTRVLLKRGTEKGMERTENGMNLKREKTSEGKQMNVLR